MIPLPTKKYKIIYADPPWQYWASGKRNAQKHYSCMPIEEIIKLPINNMADTDSILCLWGTWPILPELTKVINHWGFEYSTCLFVWLKQNKTSGGHFLGLGNYTRANTEFVLLAKKGKGIKRQTNKMSQIISTSISSHSKKPDIVRKKIVEMFGDVPRIELFARTKIHGWDVWGNDEKLQLEPLENWS